MKENHSTRNLSNSKLILFVMTISLTGLAVMGDLVLIPAVNNLYETFDNVAAVNFIVSGPALINAITALICGKLMQHVSKKSLLITGGILFAIGGIFGIAIESIPWLIAMRIVIGIAKGLLNAPAFALIAEVITNERKRGTVLGVYNAIVALCGSLNGLLAGFAILHGGWQSVFKVYWIIVPVVILMFFFLPSTQPEKKTFANSQSAIENGNKKWKTHLIAMMASFFMITILYCVVFFQVSIYVAEKAIGDAAFSGILSSIGTLGTCLASIAFGYIYYKLKRGSIIISYVMLALSFALLYFTSSATVTVIACFLIGSAQGNGFSYFFMRVTVIVPPSKVSTSISLITAGYGIGMFLSTYAVTALQAVMHVHTLSGIMFPLIIVSIVGAILSVILTIRDRKNSSEYYISKSTL